MAPIQSETDVLPYIESLQENERPIFFETTTILLRIVNNILQNPNVDKYRSLRLGNAVVTNKLLPAIGAMECLFAMGFEERDDSIFLPHTVPLSRLQIFQNHLNGIVNASSVPENRPPYQPVEQVMIQQSEQTFLHSIVSSVRLVRSYETPDLQAKARNLIPVDQLHKTAKEKVSSLENTGSSPLLLKDALLVALLSWFKNEFFKWVDSPECPQCRMHTNSSNEVGIPTDDEKKFGADRVEMYKCPHCSIVVRFPRYNDPNKLLETRKGRCGEWANCFTLMCRTMGFEARYVHDWTDHVWTEVYSEEQKRWLHCDSCENVCDNPLLYEIGWGKKLSYILAFAHDDIQDVTWRYTCNFSDVVKRRTKCREYWLLKTILNLRGRLQLQHTEQQKRKFEQRLVVELVEFLTLKKPSSSEQTGRTSGSLLWRLQRGEAGPASENVKVWVPGEDAIQAKKFVLKYSPDTDLYVAGSETVSGWLNGVYESKNMFRKLEHDWKKAYLCRTEGSTESSVTWKFEIGNPNLLIDTAIIACPTATFENGKVRLKICTSDSCVLLPAGKLSHEVGILNGCTSFTITAMLTGGIWQHTQLFRQDIGDNQQPFCVELSLIHRQK